MPVVANQVEHIRAACQHHVWHRDAGAGCLRSCSSYYSCLTKVKPLAMAASKAAAAPPTRLIRWHCLQMLHLLSALHALPPLAEG